MGRLWGSVAGSGARILAQTLSNIFGERRRGGWRNAGKADIERAGRNGGEIDMTIRTMGLAAAATLALMLGLHGDAAFYGSAGERARLGLQRTTNRTRRDALPRHLHRPALDLAGAGWKTR